MNIKRILESGAYSSGEILKKVLTNSITFNEAGEGAGSLELVKTPPEKARNYAEKVFQDAGRDLDKEMPDFDANYKIAQAKAGTGKTVRKDMPVIDDDDVRMFKHRLKNGVIDLDAPFKDKSNQSNPFPKGLSPKTAKTWLTDGLKLRDGDSEDDKVPVKVKGVTAQDLKPIQKQIYFDKSIGATAQFGTAASAKFMKTTTFIASADNYIIDGHHRFLSAMLIDPKMKVNALVIDLPIAKLLPLSLSYGDAIGNKRNA